MENKTLNIQKHEMYNKLIDRIDVFKSLLIFVDEVRESSLSETSYLRIKSGLEYLIYEFNQMLDFGLDRPITMDDLSAKEIAEMSKFIPLNGKDVIVKNGIDKEIEYICSFVDDIVESPDKMLNSKEMIRFIQNQTKVNKEIEKLYKK